MNSILTSLAVDFLKDSPLCEWAYSIDFETKEHETWMAGQLVADYIMTEYEVGSEDKEGWTRWFQK